MTDSSPTLPDNEAIRQLGRAGYLNCLTDIEPGQGIVRATFDLALIGKLRDDGRFASGILYRLHTDIGHDLIDFRSFAGAFGKGSLQIVIDKKTGKFYADVDKYNVYQDLVGLFGHAFGEVLPYVWRRFWKKG